MLQEQRDNSRGARELQLRDHLNGFGDLTLVFALNRLKKVVFHKAVLYRASEKGVTAFFTKVGARSALHQRGRNMARTKAVWINV